MVTRNICAFYLNVISRSSIFVAPLIIRNVRATLHPEHLSRISPNIFQRKFHASALTYAKGKDRKKENKGRVAG